MMEVEKSTADVIAALLAENDALRAALAEHGYGEISETKANGLVLAASQPAPDCHQSGLVTAAKALASWCLRNLPRTDAMDGLLHGLDEAISAASQPAPEPWGWHLRDLTLPHDKLGVVVRERDRLAIAQPAGEWEVTPIYAAPLGQPAQPVAWGESYDCGKSFETVSTSKTRHHTFPLYTRAEIAAMEASPWH